MELVQLVKWELLSTIKKALVSRCVGLMPDTTLPTICATALLATMSSMESVESATRQQKHTTKKPSHVTLCPASNAALDRDGLP